MTKLPQMYGKLILTSKRKPAQAGPIIRPRLIKELLSPMASPWPLAARFEIRDDTEGRKRALLIA